MKPKVTVYVYNANPETRAEWRWRAKAKNGLIVASGEGYQRKAACMRTVRLLFADNPTVRIVEGVR